MTEETKREQAFYVVRPNGRKIVMTLDSVFGENDEETEHCIGDLKEAFAEGATFAILDAEEAFKSYGICPRVYHENLKHDGWQSGKTHPLVKGIYERHFTDGVFEQYWNGEQWLFSVNGDRHWRQVGDYPCWRSKLWAVNIPPEPDSIQFYPVPSLEIAKELTERLKKEAKERFKINGDVIADSIYFQKWKGTAQEHADYLKNHPDWWIHATFLDAPK